MQECHQCQHVLLKKKTKERWIGASFVNVFLHPWGILANVKISRLSAFSWWSCDLFPSCVALGLRPRETHGGNKSHNLSLQADNPYLMYSVMNSSQFCFLGSVGVPRNGLPLHNQPEMLIVVFCVLLGSLLLRTETTVIWMSEVEERLRS